MPVCEVLHRSRNVLPDNLPDRKSHIGLAVGRVAGSITFRKDECHVTHLLLRKILSILLPLENIHSQTCVRFSSWSREESQLQAEPDQHDCKNRDSVMRAHTPLRLLMAWNAKPGGIRNPNQTPDVEENLC